MFDSNGKIIEINTFAKNLEQMNLRRNFNDEFILYYKYQQIQGSRKRLKVENGLSKTLNRKYKVDSR